jgi:hypothetical protein
LPYVWFLRITHRSLVVCGYPGTVRSRGLRWRDSGEPGAIERALHQQCDEVKSLVEWFEGIEPDKECGHGQML